VTAPQVCGAQISSEGQARENFVSCFPAFHICYSPFLKPAIQPGQHFSNPRERVPASLINESKLRGQNDAFGENPGKFYWAEVECCQRGSIFWNQHLHLPAAHLQLVQPHLPPVKGPNTPLPLPSPPPPIPCFPEQVNSSCRHWDCSCGVCGGGCVGGGGGGDDHQVKALE